MRDRQRMILPPIKPRERADIRAEPPRPRIVPPRRTLLRRPALYREGEVCTVDVGHAV